LKRNLFAMGEDHVREGTKSISGILGEENVYCACVTTRSWRTEASIMTIWRFRIPHVTRRGLRTKKAEFSMLWDKRVAKYIYIIIIFVSLLKDKKQRGLHWDLFTFA